MSKKMNVMKGSVCLCAAFALLLGATTPPSSAQNTTMSERQPQQSRDSDAIYMRDKIAATKPFDKVAFARTFTHRTAGVNGVNIHYVIGGSGDPVLLLHGWPETWYSWHKVMPALAKRYTVIAPDLPGIGNSSAPKSYDKKTVAALLRQFVQQLGYRRIFLVGHDMGATVAYAYTYAYPEEVRRLVFMEAMVPGFGLEEIMNFATGGSWHFGFQGTPDVATPLVQGRERFYLTYSIAPVMYNPAALTEALEEYIRAYSQPGVLRAGFEYYAAFLQDGRDNRAAFKGKLQMPVMGIAVAGKNAGLPDTLRQVAQDVRPLIVEQSGHFIQEERPVYLAEQLLKFFGEEKQGGVTHPTSKFGS